MVSLRTFRTQPVLRRPAAAVVALASLSVAADLALSAAFAPRNGDAVVAAWLPRLGTPGETMAAYLTALELLQAVALPAALCWLAYAYGRYTASREREDSTPTADAGTNADAD